MDTIRLTIAVNYDGLMNPEDVDDIVERLESLIVNAIEHDRLSTQDAAPADYNFEYEAE